MTYATAPQSKPLTTLKRSTQKTTVPAMSTSLSEPPTVAMLKDAGDTLIEHPPHVHPKLKDDEDPTKPLSISSARDFEDMSQDMHRLFEGRETEQNWDRRRKAIIKISRITHGNAPVEYRTHYITFIKSSLDGILKVVNSLRTNVTTAGLNLLQHIADTLGHGVDFMVDFVAETLIARSCNTSKVKRDPAIATFESIMKNATCNKNVLHYILSASEHKDPNARTAVAGWLIAILTRNGRHCDQPSLLDIIEKCIKNGLNDAKPQVRIPMRETCGEYAKLWPERAEKLRSNLDTKTQKMLDSSDTAIEPAKSSLKRPSIRDIKAAKKKELEAQQMPRPESAEAKRPSIKDNKAGKVREMGAKDIVRPPSAHAARDSKTLQRRDVNVEDVSGPSSTRSTQIHNNKDTKVAKRREAEADDLVRPPSSHPTRSSTRDLKTSRAEPDGTGRPLSAQSNNSTRKLDAEAQESGRPMSGQLHASTNERRFHILSSAPMRPQRGFVDLKRAVPKPAPGQQQQVENEPPRSTKQTIKSKNEAPASLRQDVSQLDNTTTRPVKAETHTRTHRNVPAPGVQIPAPKIGLNHRRTRSDEAAGKQRADRQGEDIRKLSPTLKQGDGLMKRKPSLKKDEGTRPRSSSLKQGDGQVKRTPSLKKDQGTRPRSSSLKQGDGQVQRSPSLKQDDGNKSRSPFLKKGDGNRHRSSSLNLDDQNRSRSSSLKQGDKNSKQSPSLERNNTQTAHPIEIHEDNNSSDQDNHARAPRITKRRSGEALAGVKKVGKVPSRKNSLTLPSPPNVLREIDQLNQTVEPVKRQENTRQKYISTETAERNRSVSPNSIDPVKALRQLIRAVQNIRDRSMDDYGYRRLQGLIKAHDALFQDEEKYDELLLALLDTLETPNTERRQPLGHQFNNKFQILVTTRLMLAHSAKYCVAYHPRALSALITARRNFESRSHIVGGLEETAADIVAACSPADVIDPVLDVLDLQENDELGYRAISMGLHILVGLVTRLKGAEITDKNQEKRLARFALKCLRDEKSETRRATIAFCVELRRLINPEKRYFQMVAGNDEALKSLLTYFIATTGRK